MCEFIREFQKAVKTTLDVVVSGAVMCYAEKVEKDCGVSVNQVAPELDYFRRAMADHADNLLSETALYNYIK